MLYENYIVFTDLGSLGSSTLSSTWLRVNAQMRTSLPFPFTLRSLSLIDRVCAAKAYPEEIPIHPSCSASAHQCIDISSLQIFSFLFRFLFYFDLTTVCCVKTACGQESSCNHDGPVRIQCLCTSSADIPKWVLYGDTKQKGVWHTVLYNGFRFVL